MADVPEKKASLPPNGESVPVPVENEETLPSASGEIAPLTTEPQLEELPPPPAEEPALEEPPSSEPTPEEQPPPEPTPEEPPQPEPTPEEPPPPEPTPEEPPQPEPTPEEPPPPEPSPEEPSPPEPTPEEPPQPEPTPEEPSPPEPVLEEATPVEPILEDPSSPEPIPEEPNSSEPVLEEPPPLEPTPEEPPPPEPVLEEPLPVETILEEPPPPAPMPEEAPADSPPPERSSLEQEPTMEDLIKLAVNDLSQASESGAPPPEAPPPEAPPPEALEEDLSKEPSGEEQYVDFSGQGLTSGNEEEEDTLPENLLNEEEEEEEPDNLLIDLSGEEPLPQEEGEGPLPENKDNLLNSPSDAEIVPQGSFDEEMEETPSKDLIDLLEGEQESSGPPKPSIRNMPTDGSLVGETDNQDWILEKMFRSMGASSKDPGGSTVNAECIVPPKTIESLDPDRKGNWVLEKMFRQPGKKCDIAEVDTQEAQKSTIPLEASNLYEQDGQWVLEKLSRKSKIGFGGTLQTEMGGCPGPCLTAQDQKFCSIGRTLMVACDSLTGCDFIGTTECDLPIEEREPDMWDWVADLVLGLFAHKEILDFDPDFTITTGGEEVKVDEGQGITDNCN